MSLFLLFNFLLNGAYSLVVGYGYNWTGFIIIATNVYVLYQAYEIMQIGLRNDVYPLTKICEHLPVSLNIAWLVVAVAVDFSQVTTASGWITTQDFAIANLTVVAVISIAVGLTRADLAYALVTVWAYVAIAFKQTHPVNVACFLGIGLCVGFTVIGYIYEKYFQQYGAVGQRIPIVARDFTMHRPSQYKPISSV